MIIEENTFLKFFSFYKKGKHIPLDMREFQKWNAGAKLRYFVGLGIFNKRIRSHIRLIYIFLTQVLIKA
jgi:hypothetical protein